jgi:hypothetical protein
MPDEARIRLEGRLEQVESWRDAMRLGLDAARNHARYGGLVEALEQPPAEAEQAVRTLLPRAPQLRRLVDELDRLRTRARRLIAGRARRLRLPEELLPGARALAHEPVELEVTLFDGDAAGGRAAVAIAGVVLALPGIVLLLGVLSLAVLAVALPVALIVFARTSVRVIVTRRRVLIGPRTVERAGLQRATLEASVHRLLPKERVTELYDTLWPKARSRGHD